MASSAPASTLLQSLQPRPPTPPRDLRTYDIKPEAPGRPSPLSPRLSLHTPPNVHSPVAGVNSHSNPSSARAGKRVGWSGQNQYYKDPSDSLTNGTVHKPSPRPSMTQPYKSSPLCSEVRPIKGILKASSSPITLSPSFAGQLNGQAHPINIIEMLDSTIKQLAGSDRDSKRDAYMALARALKASNNLPDRVALQNKMSLFMQFIQRDMTVKDDNNTVDTSLLNHALTLLATFLQFPGIASTITSEFAVFVIDYCIRAFDDSSLSKDAIRHLMQVVALQSFPAKLMTLDRVGRLVSSLHRIEDHYSGKGIVMKRLHIYKKLVNQSRNHMAAHSEWLKDVFTDMLSTIGDIQNQAISLGMEAGYSLRPGTQMLRKALEILQTKKEEISYVEFYMGRLREMSKDRQRSPAVPRIWSVITLFLRCPLEKWEYYGRWFSLIQASFNSSDINTKLEANYAWNRYSFISLVDNGISQKLLLSLCQPLLSQLRRKPNAKHPEDGVKLRKTVIGGICTLYYYAFRPGNDKKTPPPDLVWEHAVYPVFAQLLGLVGAPETHRPDDILQASRILISLLNVSTPVVWREDRIMDLPPVKPEELPSIESKWIRRNSAKIFRVVRPILENKFTDLANKESLAYRLWSGLVGSIAAASAKDIKVSDDTVAFLAEMMGLLSNIWSKGCPNDDGTVVSALYSSVQTFVTSTVQALGILPFMEKKLSMTVSRTFEPVATPSHHTSRSDKGRGIVRTSLHHLFSMLSSVPNGGEDNMSFADFFQSTMEPFVASKNGRSTFSLMKELLRLIPDTTLSPYATWALGAKAMRASLSATVITDISQKDEPLNSEFREIASFLERGVTLHPNLPYEQWLSLLEPFSSRVTTELGDAGRVLVITEPLARVLLDTLETATSPLLLKKLEMVCVIISSAKLPRDKQAMGVAKRRLWGSIPTQKPNSADPFEYLPKLINYTLQRCYDDTEVLGTAVTLVCRLLSAVCTFLQNLGTENITTQLAKLEKGVSPWVEDNKTPLGFLPESPIGDALHQLWSEICDRIASLGHLQRDQFDQLEGLLTAGFKSKHTFIVKKTAEVWNVLAREEEELHCSDDLKNTASSLQSIIELVAPGTEGSDGQFGAQTALFVESQEALVLSTGSSHNSEHQTSMTNRFKQSKLSKKRHLESTAEQPPEAPPKKRSAKTKKASTPPLRHDNSQIQFEPIPDSPPRVEESQHFTEKQKEMRERQKENAVVYSDIHSTSPSQVVDPATSYEEELQPPKERVLLVERTPEKASSYQELISSTPTPRRGQFIPMENDNDPPSSPPEPRPYPLLSEIRSRSRANNSLDDWEFSSPPSSPVTSRQQILHDADPPHITMTDESTQANVAALTRARNTRQPQTPTKVAVPRTAVAKSQSHNENGATSGPFIPKTPQRSKVEERTSESPRSGDDEFVDAKAEIERSSPTREVEQPDGDTSFALSEGDESHMMRLIVELESRQRDLSLPKQAAPTAPKSVRECITVQADSESEAEASIKGVHKTMHAIIPSTPVEEPIANSESNSKGKRKREAKLARGGRKKRKSADKAEPSQFEENQSQLSQEAAVSTSRPTSAPETPSGIRTRQSARKELERKIISQSQDQEDERDTDEEVMSQIIGESFAASQSQQDTTQESDLPSIVEDSVNMGSVPVEPTETNPEPATEQSPAETEKKADYVLEFLKGGVETLQNAALSRKEVNQIEDVLMDLKRALYAAEEKGRKQQPNTRKLRQRRSKRLGG